MHPIVRNILAIIAGLALGMVVNGGLISISGSIIPLPEGVDPNDMESLKASMASFPPKNFIMPFLAHALGTLVAAFVAARIAATHKMKFALGMGAFFLVGGIAASNMLPAPLWYDVVDLVGAYIPMGYLGGLLGGRKTETGHDSILDKQFS